jgi:NAD(P)H dehydrogenase (quinone)
MLMITGASGQLGRRTVELLRERVDASQIVALSRTPEKLADLGVATRAADFSDPAGLLRAFDGAERLLLVSTDDLRPGGHRLQQHTNAVEAAVKAGVGHVLYTSAPRATDSGNDAPITPDHAATERVLAASGLTYTSLRNNLYADLLLLLSAPGAIASGVLASNSGDGRTGFGVREDYAAASAALLAVGGHENETLELTGPAALNIADIAVILSELAGRPIRYQPRSDAEATAAFVAHGIPAPIAAILADIGRATRDGWFDLVTTNVEALTGRPATTVQAFLAANRSALLGA